LTPEHERLLLRTILPLQVVLHYRYYFLWLYYASAIVTIILKANLYMFPTTIVNWEIAVLVFHFLIEATRMILGNKGNKTNRRSMIVLFGLLSIPVVFGNVFFMFWQTYIFKYDEILNGISMCFLGMEFCLAISAYSAFSTLKEERG
jgi:hypothetical protein